MIHECVICKEPAEDWVSVPVLETTEWICKFHSDKVGVFRNNGIYSVDLIENYDWQNWWCNRLNTEQRMERIKAMFASEVSARMSADSNTLDIKDE